MRRRRREEEEVFEVDIKTNFKVSTSEAWFPELERVLNSGKDEYFSPENTGGSGPLCPTGLTLHG